jgi:hypothetical protein
MAVIGTFSGINIIALPSDTIPGVTAPSSIEWNPQEKVGEVDATFGFQSQVWDWMQSMWMGQVSFPPMTRYNSDAWRSFILEARGGVNAFMLGDPKAKSPKGCALGSPVLTTSGQTGYSITTTGWQVNTVGLLYFGDYIQIGNRLYSVTDTVTSDGSGNATLTLWPNLRDQPPASTAIITRKCKGLFRLATSTGNKFSTNVGNYGFTGFAIREAGVA